MHTALRAAQHLRFIHVGQRQPLDCAWHVLAEPWADTTTSTGRLMIAVLGGLADVERDLIRTRTAEGRARKKAQGGSVGGRPPKFTPAQKAEAIQRLEDGEPLAAIARTFNVSLPTISRLRP